MGIANISLGRCDITIDGADVGLTRGECVLTVSGDIAFATAEEYGSTRLRAFDHGMNASVRIPVLEPTLANMQIWFPYFTLANVTQLGYGHVANGVGAEITGVPLVLTPLSGTSPLIQSVNLPFVVASKEQEWHYLNADNSQILSLRFDALLDPTPTYDGQGLFYYVYADGTAPTISSSSPADAADGIAVGATVTVTFSETMDTSSVNDRSVFFVEHTTLDEDTYQVTGGLSYSWATNDTVLTVAHTNFTAASEVALIVTKNVRDVAGNAKASTQIVNFTTS